MLGASASASTATVKVVPRDLAVHSKPSQSKET
jgi:hypothetical protein